MISSKMHYQPKTILELGTQEELMDCALSEAQQWCNFVLFQMTYLPQGFAVTKQQLRKESSSCQSSFRFVITYSPVSIINWKKIKRWFCKKIS